MPRRKNETTAEAFLAVQELASHEPQRDPQTQVVVRASGQCAHMKSGHCGRCARTFKSAGTVKKQTRVPSVERHWWRREVRLRQEARRQRVSREPVTPTF